MREAKTSPFHKAIFLFPTGQHIVGRTVDMAAQGVADKRCATAIAELKIGVDKLPAPKVNLESCAVGLKCLLQCPQFWSDNLQKLALVSTTGSADFLREHEATLAQVAGTISLGQQAVVQCIWDNYMKVADEQLAKLSKEASKINTQHAIKQNKSKEADINDQ